MAKEIGTCAYCDEPVYDDQEYRDLDGDLFHWPDCYDEFAYQASLERDTVAIN